MKIIITLLLLVCVLNAGSLRKQIDPMPQLLKLKQQSSYANNLVSTLQLHLTSGGVIDEVITYVQETLSQAQSDKTELNSEFEAEMETYDSEIATLNIDLESMKQELEQTILNILKIRKEIEVLEFSESGILEELGRLSERENNVRAARENDLTAYNQRQQRDENAINALSDIIPILEELLESGSNAFIQKTQDELSTYLKEKNVSDPIKTLVQTSMKFNRAKLSTVIQKLRNVQEAVIEGQKLDQQQESESESRFNLLISEISQIRQETQGRLKRVQQELSLKNAALNLATQTKSRLENNIQSTTALRDSTQQSRDLSEKNYRARLQELSQAIQALQDALVILKGGQPEIAVAEENAENEGGWLGPI